MIDIVYRIYDPNKKIEKNVLYKITERGIIQFVEAHESFKEVVNIEYCLGDGQYGIYANEYRRPGTKKEGCKTTLF